jgi:hypothetical protein
MCTIFISCADNERFSYTIGSLTIFFTIIVSNEDVEETLLHHIKISKHRCTKLFSSKPTNSEMKKVIKDITKRTNYMLK